MLDSDRQLCSHCDYEITGIAPLGRLVRCPECGHDNRIGAVDLDAMHPDLPPWWRLGLSLGWPALPWLYFALAAWRYGDQPLIVAAVILGGLVLFVALARATMIAFDCSIPDRRGRALSWTLLWAVLGSVLVPLLVSGIFMALIGFARLLESARPS
jgi:hypothetical protein